MAYQYVNAHPDQDSSPFSELPSPFQLKSPPDTDVWKKPPTHDVFNAPICYRTLKLSSFRSASVRISADWRTLFDQGGLCLVIPAAPSSSGAASRKWIKTGVELFNHKAYVSAVACDQWADWSLWPMSGNTVTIQIEREIRDGKPTSTLWIYVVEGDNKLPIREVSWVFAPEHEAAECWVGLYAAKPTKDADDPQRSLEVTFHDFELGLA